MTDYLDISNRVYGRPAKAICFSAGVAHGAELVKRFAEAGINAVQLSYRDEDEFKDSALREFSRHDTDIQILISADLLTRGYDETSIEHVILARPLRKSFSSFVQMIGRGARPHDNMEFCTIQDNSGNWLRFKDQWDKLYHDGVDELSTEGEKKPAKEPTEKEKKECKCPRCNALWVSNSDTCSICGFVRERVNKVENVAGEIKELAGESVKKEKFSPQFKENFFAELLHYAISKNYSQGWAAWKCMQRFGHFPHKKNGIQPIPPSAETLAYIKYMNIKQAKSKK